MVNSSTVTLDAATLAADLFTPFAPQTHPSLRQPRLVSTPGLGLSKDQQVSRTRTRQRNTRQQNKPLTRTQRATAQRRLIVEVVVAALKIVVVHFLV